MEEVPDETVEDDWNTRFTNGASDISNEAMQKLWGQILAGEIKQPGSFSLRALDALKNMSKSEAVIFEKLIGICFEYNSTEIVFLDMNAMSEELKKEKEVDFTDVKLLMDISLVHSAILSYDIKVKKDANKPLANTPDVAISISNKTDKDLEFSLTVTSLSPIGRELATLVSANEVFSTLYLSEIKKNLIIGSLVANKNIDTVENADLILYKSIKIEKGKVVPKSNPIII